MFINRQHGLTLIELIVFIVIVGVGLAGVLSSLNVSVRGSADPLKPKQALAIAEALMEEILLKNHSDPGAAACSASVVNARNCYDDVGDYSSFPSGTTIYAADGLNSISGYSATVNLGTASVGGVSMRQITVTITPTNGTAVSLVGYRANY